MWAGRAVWTGALRSSFVSLSSRRSSSRLHLTEHHTHPPRPAGRAGRCARLADSTAVTSVDSADASAGQAPAAMARWRGRSSACNKACRRVSTGRSTRPRSGAQRTATRGSTAARSRRALRPRQSSRPRSAITCLRARTRSASASAAREGRWRWTSATSLPAEALPPLPARTASAQHRRWPISECQRGVGLGCGITVDGAAHRAWVRECVPSLRCAWTITGLETAGRRGRAGHWLSAATPLACVSAPARSRRQAEGVGERALTWKGVDLGSVALQVCVGCNSS